MDDEFEEEERALQSNGGARAWSMDDGPFKLVLIVNMGLKMGKGKVSENPVDSLFEVAQVAGKCLLGLLPVLHYSRGWHAALCCCNTVVDRAHNKGLPETRGRRCLLSVTGKRVVSMWCTVPDSKSRNSVRSRKYQRQPRDGLRVFCTSIFAEQGRVTSFCNSIW